MLLDSINLDIREEDHISLFDTSAFKWEWLGIRNVN